jgi:hypothetical protein
MTTLGGLGHALPYLIPDFWTATTLSVSLVLWMSTGSSASWTFRSGIGVQRRRGA